jgi:glyoxylase-like metal-dependent hydrolase (beta-lactamase superfamily II)
MFQSKFIRSARFCFLILLGGLTIPFSASFAQAAFAKIQAPGFYRFKLGTFEVTALSDGTIPLPVDQLLDYPKAQISHDLQMSYLKSPVDTSVNGYLINTGEKLILIDTGAGAFFGPTVGKLVSNLRASGYQPEQVDEIYITHMHADHIGGLVDGEKVVFPNALLRADKKEADFWLTQSNMEKASESNKDFFKNALAAVIPYIKIGHYKTFDGETKLSEAIKALPSSGHTPGHTTYSIQSNGERLDVVGDLIHVGPIQFANPSVTVHFDIDTKNAKKARMNEFRDATKTGYLVAAAHIAFPGVGHLRESGTGFTWIPINYASTP